MKDAIKNETKSYFKIPAWLLLFVLVCSFIYCAVDNLNLEKCENQDKSEVLIAYSKKSLLFRKLFKRKNESIH